MRSSTSVIISTYNGAEKIPFLLEALKNQTYNDFEIIVVVDGSTDNTIEKLNEFTSLSDKIRVITQTNSGRSKVRNRGVKVALGDLLIFYDDDMIPIPNSIEMHVKRFLESPERLVTGNPIELFDSTKSDIQNYKANLTTIWVNKYKSSFVSLNSSNLFFTAANCSMSRVIFERLGGFDERLTDAEDYNLGLRALESGVEVYFDKENKAIHREFITARSYILRLREYRVAHKYLTELYPHYAKLNFKTIIYKRWIYLLFASKVWVDMIDNNSLNKLPLQLRYKLYNIIIHALAVEYPEVKI